MTFPQPGRIDKSSSGITLNPLNDVAYSTTSSGYRFLYNGSQFGVLEYNTATNSTELNLWNNDGTPVSNILFANKYVLDVNYDKADGAYYGIRWDNGPGSRIGDMFSSTYDDEGGSEPVRVFILANFTSQKDWQFRSMYQLRVHTTLLYNPPLISIKEESRVWSSFSSNYYTGYGKPSLGWKTTGWAASNNISTSSRSYANNLLQPDYDAGKLAYYTNGGTGVYNFDAEVSGNFVTFIDIVATSLNGADSVLALRALRRGTRPGDPFNHLASACFCGPTGGSETVRAWFVRETGNSAGNYWSVSNLRLHERYLKSGAVGSVVSIGSGSGTTFSVSADDYYNDPVAGVREKAVLFHVGEPAHSNLGYGVFASQPTALFRTAPYNGESYRSFSWTGGTESNPSWANKTVSFDIRAGYGWDEAAFQFNDYLDEGVVGSSNSFYVATTSLPSPVDNDKLRLAIKRVGTTITVMARDNTLGIEDMGGEYTEVASYDCAYDGPVRFELYIDGRDGTSNDVAVTKFETRALFSPEEVVGSEAVPSIEWSIPALVVETYDVDGRTTPVAGVSGDGGTVIRSLDLVRKSIYAGGAFTDWVGKVQLATDHNASGNELYINVAGGFYKYLKSSLPIMTTESGSLASIVEPGVMPSTSPYNTLNFNGYTEAGLIYIGSNTADIGDGLFVNCVRNETMLPNSPAKFVWIEDVYPPYQIYGTDVNEPSLLYGFSPVTGLVYIYNLDEYKAAFCNVISMQQIMGANTAQTSIITAQVLNAYGNPLDGKTVQFSVTAGDGSVSPESSTTDTHGEATTTYTVGATVGTSTISATVID